MSSINNRQWPRYPFGPGMWVKVVREGQPATQFKMYQLIDISQGGISFKSHAALEFKRGDLIYILEVEDKVLEDTIKAKVVYVQYLDDFGVDFKIGVEFTEKI
jgi:hypothetical protein